MEHLPHFAGTCSLILQEDRPHFAGAKKHKAAR